VSNCINAQVMYFSAHHCVPKQILGYFALRLFHCTQLQGTEMREYLCHNEMIDHRWLRVSPFLVNLLDEVILEWHACCTAKLYPDCLHGLAALAVTILYRVSGTNLKILRSASAMQACSEELCVTMTLCVCRCWATAA
jgi:hypothetical protein